MAQSIIEELTSELGKITLDNAEARESPDFQNIGEKICCNNKMRVECYDHFLTPALMDILNENLKSSNDDKVYSALCFIALLGKYEASRDYVSNIYIICLLLDNLKSKNYDILIQACRALGNICYENVKTQYLIADQGGLSPIVELLEQSTMPDEQLNDAKFKQVIVGLVLNLIADNETVQQQVAERDVIPPLVKLLKEDLGNPEASVISQNIFVTFISLTEALPVEMVFKEEVCHLVVDMYRKSSGIEFSTSGLEFLEDSELPDIVKFYLAKAGVFEIFIEMLENKPDGLTEEQMNKYELVGRVLANILSGDEAMEYVYELNDNKILNHFVSWLSSEDKDLVHTAVLCIGNIARTDRHSISIVEKEIHKHLLKITGNSKNDIKILYATVSTLRNLCIPRANKIQLVNDGIVEVLLPLLDLEVKTSSPVIFKMVGALRQLIDGQESVTIRLGSDEKLVNQLVKWSSSTLHPWVSSECSRFLCWLVNISKDRNVIINILQNGGYPQIIRMLGALHGLMQSEAITSMTVTAAAALLEANRVENVPEEEKDKSVKLLNFDSMLLEGNVGEKLKHLILQHGVRMDDQILEEVFTFLEVITKFERVCLHLSEKGFKPIFHSVMRSRDDYQRFRGRIESIENSF